MFGNSALQEILSDGPTCGTCQGRNTCCIKYTGGRQFFIGLQSHRIYRCMKGLRIENTCRMKNLSLISMVVFLIPVHDVLWVTHMEGKIPID